MLLNYILNLRNLLDFWLRSTLRWRRSNLCFLELSYYQLYDFLDREKYQQAQKEVERFIETYPLPRLTTSNNYEALRENFYYLELLEHICDEISPSLPSPLMAADIGTSHWFYVRPLLALLKYWHSMQPRKVFLRGFEVDPYRVYADFHSRYDYALANMAGLENVEFIPRSFSAHEGVYHLITMFFPFVFEQDHLFWGLPRSLFHPDWQLISAWRSLQSPGWLIIVNQGIKEHEAQKEILSSCHIPIYKAFEHSSVLYNYDLSRFVIVAQKN